MNTPKYSYSFDEERFTGSFDSFDAAFEEAKSEGANNDYAKAWIGEDRHPAEFISAKDLGSDIRDRISEILGDEVGEVAECFSLSDDQQQEIGKLVLDWIEAGPGFHCYGVKNIKEVSLIEERDTLTADLFPEGAPQ